MSLRGFVNIEANEVQFSINSHATGSLRILPQVFQDRVSLSFDKDSKDTKVHDAAIQDFKIILIRFLSICKDYGVPSGHGQVVVGASLDLESPVIDTARDTLGWPVTVLNEQQEFESFIYGLAGAFHPVHGLFIKVTARSAYMSWIHYNDEKILMYGEPHQLPYGGVTLARRLQKESFVDLEREVATRAAAVYAQLKLPPALEQMALDENGIRIYIHSRGFPSVMRFIHSGQISPLLLSSFNSTGFSCVPNDILHVTEDQMQKFTELLAKSSKSKAAFFQATLLLLKGVGTGIPTIRKYLYDRSTTREGVLFRQMPSETFAEDPLIVSTKPFALPGAARLAQVLESALPSDTPLVIRSRIVRAVANSAYIHSSYPKTTQANMGLCIGIGGILTGVPGITHEVRVLLGIALFKRWGGDPNDASVALLSAFQSLFADWNRFWWAFYVGSVMHVLGGVFPGAHVRENVISFEVDGHGAHFKLNIRVNQKSVFANNPVVLDRLRKLPSNLIGAQQRLNLDECPVQVSVQWYNG